MFPNVYVRAIAIVTAGWLLQPALLQPGFGQNKGGVTPPSTGAPAGTTGTPTTTPGRTPTTLPNNPNNPNTTSSLPQPIFVTGRVTIDDGTPLPEAVVIQRVCGGSQHAEGYTDSKGFFGIELGRNNGVMQDASEFGSGTGTGTGFGTTSMGSSGQSQSGMNSGSSNVFSDRKYMNCELQAKLPGYRSQVINLANRRPMDDPNVGTILLHRIGTAEGNTVSAVSLAAPKDARKAYERGMDALKKKKTDDAVKGFEKAVELYPAYAAAWHELGKLQEGANNPDAARKSFGAAIQADPKFTNPYLELAVMALREKNWQEVSEITERIVKLNPFDYPQAFFYNAVANYNLKNMEAAEKTAAQAEKLDTRHLLPQVIQLLGILMAQRKDYTGAAAQFRNYLKVAPDGPQAAVVRTQLVEVEKIAAGVATMNQQDQKE
jgi:tetratricopeptide (TPR) repeat protein